MICFAAAVHVTAHLFNVKNFVEKPYHRIDTDETTENVAFTSTAGATGVIVTLSLILMVTTADEQIRRSYFELFWYTHHLFIVFYVGLVFHGSSGLIEAQTNAARVPPNCYDKTDNRHTCASYGDCFTGGELNDDCTARFGGCPDQNDEKNCCFKGPDDESGCCPCLYTLPEYQRGGPKTWRWVIFPLLLYLCERLYRYYMSVTRKLKVLKVVKKMDRVPVVEIQFDKIPTMVRTHLCLRPAASGPVLMSSCPPSLRLGSTCLSTVHRCRASSGIPLR